MKSNQQQLWAKGVCLIIKEATWQYVKKQVDISVASKSYHPPTPHPSSSISQGTLADMPLPLSSAYSKLLILQSLPALKPFHSLAYAL